MVIVVSRIGSLRVSSSCDLCWLLSNRHGSKCCVMIPLPHIKDSSSVSTGLSVQSEMQWKLLLRKLQRLQMLIRMGRDVGIVLSSFRRSFVVDSL